MNKRNIILLLTVLVLGVSVLAFVKKEHKSPAVSVESITVKKLEKVTVGMPFIPGFMIASFAKEKGFYDKEGIDVSFINTIPVIGNMPKDFSSGVYDIIAVNNSLFTGNRDIHTHGKMTLLGYYALEGSAIVARKDAPDLSSAKGRTMAVLSGGDFFAYWALRTYHVPAGSVKVVTGVWENLKDDILAGKYDYVYLTAPNIERAIKESGARIVYSAKSDVGSITTGYVFSDKLLSERRDVAVAFIRAYFKGLKYAQEHKDEYKQYIVSRLAMSPSEVGAFLLDGVELLDARENERALSVGFGIKNFGANVRYIQEFLETKNGTPQADLSGRIDSSIVREAMKGGVEK